MISFTYDKEKLLRLTFKKNRYFSTVRSASDAFMEQQLKVRKLNSWMGAQPSKTITEQHKLELKLELKQLEVAKQELIKQQDFIQKFATPIESLEFAIEEWNRGNFK